MPFITQRISSISRIPGVSLIDSIFSLRLNFILPTSERSYLSALKNRFWNNCSAESLVGGSPGLIILYISTRASSLLDVGSALNVVEIYGPLSNSFIYRHCNSDTFASFKDSIVVWSISVFAGTSTSPVSVLKTSFARTFPNRKSSATFREVILARSNSRTCLAVILLFASTITLVFILRSTGNVCPLSLEGISLMLTPSFSIWTVSIS